MKIYQQGDVVFFTEKEIKGKEVKADARGYVFAEGEQTGHYHTVKDTEAVKVYEENGVKYCRVIKDNAKVVHQEHSVVTLPRGNYRIGIVQEFDPFEEEIRNVRDWFYMWSMIMSFEKLLKPKGDEE